ncbi:MAG: metallo-beta-lactamase family protein [Candidatus Peregrinibacteria bacterium Greene0416_62]|nr:MAG: metallo-beta-lactamase family protein [Candidatus Peregrinibacteria bacterium Greene0416_62]TSC99768.1 MAG: metallo-beta-lactamase family protein [Candidatus Peregrinibacteria bacterium Greene1014_49]
MRIIPHGAAREVTGSCHELQVAGKRILLDCGLFQGKRSEASIKNSTFTFDPSKDIDAMVLSHAHMDHVGRVPLLWKQGYRKPIYCTYATKDLAAVMLMDGGYIQEKDEEFHRKHLKGTMIKCDGPLYTQKDAAACMELFHGVNYGDWFSVVPGVRAQFIDAGHIVGSAMVLLEIDEGQKGQGIRRIGFTGDIGRKHLPIIRDPQPMPSVEALICESTYGNRTHEDIATAREHLRDVIVKTAKRGGKVLIPAFSLERTQEIIYDLHLLWDSRQIPALPIVIDSPLAQRVTDVFMKHPECYDQRIYNEFLSRAHNPFQFSLVRYSESIDESKALNGTPGPMIIMAGSGMCEAGRIRHHLKNELADPRNTVLAVGYMAENTLGRRIIDPALSHVRIFDEMIAKRAEVIYIHAYSGHADMADLDRTILGIDGLKQLILVHGEPLQMEPFKHRMQAIKPEMEVVMPEREEVIPI